MIENYILVYGGQYAPYVFNSNLYLYSNAITG